MLDTIRARARMQARRCGKYSGSAADRSHRRNAIPTKSASNSLTKSGLRSMFAESGRAIAETTRSRTPDTRANKYDILRDCGHHIPSERPDAIVDAVKNLARHPQLIVLDVVMNACQLWRLENPSARPDTPRSWSKTTSSTALTRKRQREFSPKPVWKTLSGLLFTNACSSPPITTGTAKKISKATPQACENQSTAASSQSQEPYLPITP